MWLFRKKETKDTKDKKIKYDRCALCEKYNKQTANYGFCNEDRVNTKIFFAYNDKNNRIKIMVPKYGVCIYFKKNKSIYKEIKTFNKTQNI